MAEEEARSPYPLYSKSFTVHRLAPLFHGDATLDTRTLEQYASQFRDILTGEVLRGVRIGLDVENDAISRIGALGSVQWSWFKDADGWNADLDQDDEDPAAQQSNSIGILVKINYEKLSYYAILLRRVKEGGQNDIAGFSHYPLLLTRMPASLRETFIGFLASTFDTRTSILRLPSSYLAEATEKYFASITTLENSPLHPDEATRVLKTIVKDILITISFDIPSVSSSLKALEFTISRDDSWRVITSGSKLLRNEGKNNDAQIGRPFTRFLSHYVNAHMGLNLDNPHVHISKVACAAFVLGMEGKIKLSSPSDDGDTGDVQSRAMKELVNNLIVLAGDSKSIGVVP